MRNRNKRTTGSGIYKNWIGIENLEISGFLVYEYSIDQLNHHNEVYPTWIDKPEVAYVCSK